MSQYGNKLMSIFFKFAKKIITVENTFTLVAKTLPGFEEILAEELKALGAENINI